MEHSVCILKSLDVRALLRLRILLPPREDEGSVFLRNVGHPYSVTWCHIPQERSPPPHHHEILLTRVSFYSVNMAS